MNTTFNLSGIPEELACVVGWLYWVGNKIPRTVRRDPITNKCNHNNPHCLATLDEVLERIRHFQCVHGLAFSFQRDFGLTYIDLDDCRDPGTGELSAFASDIVRRLHSYTEVSIGKKGLHIIVRGQVEKPRLHTKRNWSGRQVEIKPFNHYMTVSGNRLSGTPPSIECRQEELRRLYEEIFIAGSERGSEPLPRIKQAREPTAKRAQGRKRKGKAGDDVDLSACDFALCRDLAIAGMTFEEIEKALIDHPIMDRPKWRDRPEYRKRTISAALNSVCD